jgi:ferrochelatase
VRSFFDDPLFVRALAERVREGLTALAPERHEGAVVLFSAHGVPLELYRDGDPYVDQVRRTVQLVVGALGDQIGAHELSFQSRAGPVRWVGPSTVETVERLGREGVRCVLVVPVSFVSDHIETLHEIDVELARVAARSGIAELARTPSLNDGPEFLEALGAVVGRALVCEEEADA